MIAGIQDITLDGHSLTEFGCVITEPPKRPFPKRKYDKKTVYGRSGDLIIDSESYDNISFSYKVATIPQLYDLRFIDEVLSDLKAWLCGSVSYQKLYDTELPDGFYYAFCSGISDAVCTFDDMYEFSITFSCKPFFYYDIGQKTIQTTERNIMLHNIGKYAAKPVIKLYGSGKLGCYINGIHFIVSNVISSVTVDGDAMRVYSGAENKFDDFEGKYPQLAVGSNAVSFTGEGFLSAQIIPGWCRL